MSVVANESVATTVSGGLANALPMVYVVGFLTTRDHLAVDLVPVVVDLKEVEIHFVNG